MTLIAAVYDGAEWTLVSDILLSSMVKPATSPSLPMGSPLFSAPSGPRPPQFHAVGTCRKVTLISSTMAIAWAGLARVGRDITRQLIAKFQDRRLIPTDEIVNAVIEMIGRFAKTDVDELGLIILNIEMTTDGTYSQKVWSYGCEVNRFEGVEIIFAGTGAGHFIWKLSEIIDADDMLDGARLSIKQSLFTCIHRIQNEQLYIDEALASFYGGWFEMVSLSSSPEGFCLKPIADVAVANMILIEEEEGFRPTICDSWFQTYIDDVLIIMHSEWRGTSFSPTNVWCVNPAADPGRDVTNKVMKIDAKSDVLVFYSAIPVDGGFLNLIQPFFDYPGTFCKWSSSRISVITDDEARLKVEYAFDVGVRRAFDVVTGGKK